MAEFSWDDGELQAYFSYVTDGWPAHRSAILDALGDDLVRRVKRDIPVDTGRARSTVRKRVTPGDTEGEVLVGGIRGVNYIEPLLEGSRPHHPGSSDARANRRLAGWANRNGYPGGFDNIYWSIARHGTEPHDFVSEPTRETQRNAGDIGERVLRRREVFDR